MTTMHADPMLSPAHYSRSPGADAETQVLRAMFAARKRVFVDLLRWNLPVLAGRFEVDQFDNPCAEYLVLTDADGNHRGSARCCAVTVHTCSQTTMPTCALPGFLAPAVREITRFCLDPAGRCCTAQDATSLSRN
jgi:acyl homoserine lactone synthase/acyl-homoserine lactone synthase